MSEAITLPHDTDSEQALIGSCLIDSEALVQWAPAVQPEAFYEVVHQDVWRCMRAMLERNETPDMLTLSAELERTTNHPLAVLTDCIGAVANALNVETYARRVLERAERRRIIRSLTDIARAAYNLEMPIEDVREVFLNAPVLAIDLSDLDAPKTMHDAAQLVSAWLEQMQDRTTAPGVASPWTDLEMLAGPLEPGELTIVGARPSMGKSTLVSNLGDYASRVRGWRVGIFSIEMDARSWTMRILSSVADVPFDELRRGVVSNWDKVIQGLTQIDTAPAWIDDSPSNSVTSIRLKARMMKNKHGLDLVIVDYVQLIEGDESTRDQQRSEQVGRIGRDLKRMARELRVPVVAVAMVSRQVEQRADKRPMLSDLAESSKLEAHADRVYFLYRDEVYNQDTPKPGIAELIVAKHRNGPTGFINLGWDKRRQRFGTLTRDRLIIPGMATV